MPDQLMQVERRTQESFGYQWTQFSEMSSDFRENFLNYVYPLDAAAFRSKLILDAGCGFGRHVVNAARAGADVVVGMDFSDAIESARRNASSLENVALVRGDIYRPPFREGTFDIVYSLGVLHHLPDPEAGYRSLLRFVKPGGIVHVWVYSKSRRVLNSLLEHVRPVTSRMPKRVLKAVCLVAAAIDWYGFILPFRATVRLPLIGQWVSRNWLPRVRLYAQYPFQVTYADWFDRLSAPIRFYYEESDLRGWVERAGLELVHVSPTGKYGWRLQARRPA
jgi:SAM-dependent methyltransferase